MRRLAIVFVMASLLGIPSSSGEETPPLPFRRPELWEPGGAEHVPEVDPKSCGGKRAGDACGAGHCVETRCEKKGRRGRVIRYACLRCVPPAID